MLKMTPRPRILFFISLALAIPTYGISIAIFYFLKRSYDSKAASLILAKAKSCLERDGISEKLFHVNNAATNRVFWKFADVAMAEKYGVGTADAAWGVIVHPMINAGKPFSLRVAKEGGGRIKIEAAPGEDWTLLKKEYS